MPFWHLKNPLGAQCTEFYHNSIIKSLGNAPVVIGQYLCEDREDTGGISRLEIKLQQMQVLVNKSRLI